MARPQQKPMKASRRLIQTTIVLIAVPMPKITMKQQVMQTQVIQTQVMQRPQVIQKSQRQTTIAPITTHAIRLRATVAQAASARFLHGREIGRQVDR